MGGCALGRILPPCCNFSRVRPVRDKITLLVRFELPRSCSVFLVSTVLFEGGEGAAFKQPKEKAVG